jgi:hypothetical protein
VLHAAAWLCLGDKFVELISTEWTQLQVCQAGAKEGQYVKYGLTTYVGCEAADLQCCPLLCCCCEAHGYVRELLLLLGPAALQA